MTANASKVPEFVKKCIDVCWIMAVQDPPLELKTESQSFDSFNKDEYKAYTKLGQYIDFVVWPPLLLHKEGPLLAKGVAQGWGTQQGGMKSPDARNKEVPFPKEPKQAWSTTTNQTRSYPSTSAGFTYSQSPVVPTSAYPASTVACTQYEQTTVTPTSYHGTAVPMAHNQSLSPSVTDARAQSQRLTAAQAQLATYNMQNLALNQNQNTGLSYPPRQTDLLTGGNVTQQNYESQMTYGSQSSQSGANPYMYHYMYQNNQ